MDDQRDHAEEDANRAAVTAENTAELSAVTVNGCVCWDGERCGTHRIDPPLVMRESAGYTADEMAIINKYIPPAGEPATRLRTYEEVLADTPNCPNCRGTFARCNASGCGGRQHPGHRGWPVAESAGRAAIEFAAEKLGVPLEPLPEGLELVEVFQPKRMNICPGCGATFDMMAEGQMVMGSDDAGLYLEHVPCGHRGRKVLS